MVNLRSLTQSKSSFTPVQAGLLQRKCASCGQHIIAGGECGNCNQKKSGLQRKLTIGASNDPLELEADRVMASSANSLISSAPPRIQRFTGQTTGQADMMAPASVDNVLSSPGSPLEPALQQVALGHGSQRSVRFSLTDYPFEGFPTFQTASQLSLGPRFP